ncbi:MAG: glutamate-5-semialdehyde dehydrogenase [Chlamydiales bacterium]
MKAAKEAKKASYAIRLASSDEKIKALEKIAASLNRNRDKILHANHIDLKKAKNLPSYLLDRLSLENSLDDMIESVSQIARLPDPVGEVIEKKTLPNGLQLQKKRIPIGVLGVIYEARPNVTTDIAALALKSSNSAVLRGGKETFHTNKALIDAIQEGLAESSLPKEAIQWVKSTARSEVKKLIRQEKYIDMIIPRGGEELHRFCRQYSTIPVIAGGIGICHLFVDAGAAVEESINVIVNAKTDRPSVCNALDTLLVHREIAPLLLPPLIEQLQKKKVSLRLDTKTWALVQPIEMNAFQRASDKDWQTEWLSLVLGIKIVSSLQEAIAHIHKYSSSHSDGILTNSAEHAKEFIKAIDSATVYVNASTRFTDGGQFGLGAEVAVSTQKLHARGPMGLKELTTYKWIVEGNYHIRGKG